MNHRYPIFTIFILFILLCTATPAAAAPLSQDTLNDAITLNAQAGFDGFRKGNGWIPMQIEIANSGPAVAGELRVFTGTNRPTYTTPVTLPNQSNRRISFQVYLPLNNSQLTVRLYNEQGEEIANTITNPIRTLNKSSLLYGVVTPNPDTLEFLDDIKLGRSEAGVAYLNMTHLPRDPVAWDMLDVLVLHNVDTSQLSAAQLTALQSWIELGGQLVVTGGPNWQPTVAAVADWLPVTPTDTTSVENLPALAEEVGVEFRDPGPYVVTTSSLSSGELILREDNTPLLARRPFGRGNVFFLALDPQFAPLVDWGGSEVIWSTIASYAPRTPVWGEGFRNEDRAASAVESLPSLTLPSPALFFIFLGAYIIIIGPVNYYVLNRIGRREWAWFSIPATILLFSLIAYITGVQFKGNRVIINQMSFVYGEMGTAEARVNTAVGLYSPRRGEYDIVFDEGSWVRPLSGFRLDTRPTTISHGPHTVVEDLLVDVSEVSTFNALNRRPLPNISGAVIANELDSGVELEISVSNNEAFALQNATLIIGDDGIALGDIPAGESRTVTKIYRAAVGRTILSAANDSPTFTPATSSSADMPLEKHYNDLLGTATYYYNSEPAVRGRFQLLEALGEPFGTPTPAWKPRGTVTLIGWSDQPQLEIELASGRYDTSSTTAYFLEIPFQQ